MEAETDALGYEIRDYAEEEEEFPWHKPPPGRYEDVPSEVYHSWDALNSSKIGLILRSPAHLKASLDFPEQPTPDMLWGEAIHYAVLQPDEYEARYCGEPPEKPKGKTFNARYKEGKVNTAKWKAAVLQPWLDENEGKIRLPRHQLDSLDPIRQAIERTPAARHVLGLGLKESSYVWVDPTTGLLCRCRPDVSGESRNLLVDLKSSRDARPEAFSRAMAAFGYYRQAPWYLDGVNAVLGEGTVTDFVFVVVEKYPPYGVGVYVLDRRDIERGRRENELALKKLAWCYEKDQWPGYGARISPIGLPRWARNQLDAGEPQR